MQLAPLAMARSSGFAPDKLASFECRLVVWIGDGRLQRGIGKAREARELIFSALRYRQRQLGAEIAEEEEWPRRRKFLTHEQERRGEGASRMQATAARSARGLATCPMRSPNARLPTWSWVCRKETKAPGGRCTDGSPRAMLSRYGEGCP